MAIAGSSDSVTALVSKETGLDVESAGTGDMDDQERLGRMLQEKRDEAQMGLGEIARITKIPQAALLHIEAGKFDNLPGDVFARGFLRSYARCVGLDGDDVVRQYAKCGLQAAPVSSAMADDLLGSRRKSGVRHARGSVAPVSAHRHETSAGTSDKKPTSEGAGVRKVLRDAFDLGLQFRANASRDVPKKKSQGQACDAFALNKGDAVAAKSETQEAQPVRTKRERIFVPPSFDFEPEMTHRGPLTLGVIILVIVATLTMSYLLRRPGSSTDGFTLNDVPAALQQGAVVDSLASTVACSRAAASPIAQA